MVAFSIKAGLVNVSTVRTRLLSPSLTLLIGKIEKPKFLFVWNFKWLVEMQDVKIGVKKDIWVQVLVTSSQVLLVTRGLSRGCRRSRTGGVS